MITAPKRRPPSRLRLPVQSTEAGFALARFVEVRGGVSADEARAAIDRGGTFVGGRRVKDAAHALSAGDHVEVILRERGAPVEVPAALEPTRLLHLDAQVVCVDKPAGVLAQTGRAGGTALPELVAALLLSRGEPSQALLVHRLDRGTTGCTLLARTRRAQATLLELFREGKVRKEYRAWVQGEPREDAFVVDLALGPDPLVQGRRRVDPRGEAARTRFQVLERGRGTALIAAFPETGRTHQIRVHLAAQNLPLLGDPRYGGPQELTRSDGQRLELSRPLLHALAIELAHPEPACAGLSIFAPLPEEFLQASLFLR